MTAPRPRDWVKLLSIWMNAVVSAWNMGEADWAFDGDGRSRVVRVWSSVFAGCGSEQEATDAVVAIAKGEGVDPKRHKVHAR